CYAGRALSASVKKDRKVSPLTTRALRIEIIADFGIGHAGCVRLAWLEGTAPPVQAIPSRISSNAGALTSLVNFEAAPFPYHGFEPVSAKQSLFPTKSAETDRPNGVENRSALAQRLNTRAECPQNAACWRARRKSLEAVEWLVGLRGLELRAKHAVAIEPVSRG